MVKWSLGCIANVIFASLFSLSACNALSYSPTLYKLRDKEVVRYVFSSVFHGDVVVVVVVPPCEAIE
jgi:hypothetical protein